MPGAWLEALHPHFRAVVLLDADRAVVKFDLLGLAFDTVFVIGLASRSPRVSWPKTARGFPIVTITDDPTRERIEAEIVAEVLAELDKPRRKAAAT